MQPPEDQPQDKHPDDRHDEQDLPEQLGVRLAVAGADAGIIDALHRRAAVLRVHDKADKNSVGNVLRVVQEQEGQKTGFRERSGGQRAERNERKRDNQRSEAGPHHRTGQIRHRAGVQRPQRAG